MTLWTFIAFLQPGYGISDLHAPTVPGVELRQLAIQRSLANTNDRDELARDLGRRLNLGCGPTACRRDCVTDDQCSLLYIMPPPPGIPLGVLDNDDLFIPTAGLRYDTVEFEPVVGEGDICGCEETCKTTECDFTCGPDGRGPCMCAEGVPSYDPGCQNTMVDYSLSVFVPPSVISQFMERNGATREAAIQQIRNLVTGNLSGISNLVASDQNRASHVPCKVRLSLERLEVNGPEPTTAVPA